MINSRRLSHRAQITTRHLNPTGSAPSSVRTVETHFEERRGSIFEFKPPDGKGPPVSFLLAFPSLSKFESGPDGVARATSHAAEQLFLRRLGSCSAWLGSTPESR